MKIFYLCNGKACREKKGRPGYTCYYDKDAKYHWCKHTTDIEYAKNFIKKDNGDYREKEPDVEEAEEALAEMMEAVDEV